MFGHVVVVVDAMVVIDVLPWRASGQGETLFHFPRGCLSCRTELHRAVVVCANYCCASVVVVVVVMVVSK